MIIENCYIYAHSSKKTWWTYWKRQIEPKLLSFILTGIESTSKAIKTNKTQSNSSPRANSFTNTFNQLSSSPHLALMQLYFSFKFESNFSNFFFPVRSDKSTNAKSIIDSGKQYVLLTVTTFAWNFSGKLRCLWKSWYLLSIECARNYLTKFIRLYLNVYQCYANLI